jgi:inner membrane protein
VNSVFKTSLFKSEISFERYQTQPTILNNFLWYGIAETSTNYYVGFYSIMDKNGTVDNWLKLPKNHDLLNMDHSDLQTLAWFSNGYFNLLPVENNEEIRYNDLRYPLLNADDPNSSIFSFALYKDGVRYNFNPSYGKPPSRADFNTFIKRIKGI